MLTKEFFEKSCKTLYEFCEYPAIKYKILLDFFDFHYDNQRLTLLRPQFFNSDIVNELYNAQSPDGNWGSLNSKDYSAKDKFPTTMVALNRCLYIGLKLQDRDVLITALDYLEDFLKGQPRVKLYNKNERAIPWQLSDIATMVERISSYNPLCDKLCFEWTYIAERAFADGEYSHEKDKKAQQEIFYTREDRLVPLPIGLLLGRRNKLASGLESAMLHHFGEHVYYHGHFWDNCPARLPDNFVYEKTRRWFHSFNYINQFKNTKEYLGEAIDWLIKNQNSDGLWDYGTQTKDPWGYFGYFSTNRNYKYNKVVDCTMEILNVFNTYIKNNEEDTNGYEWANDVAPKIQLAPMGYHGYIEGRPVKPINK